MHAPTVGYTESYYVEDSILDEDTGQHRWSDVSIRDHWVTGMTVAELIPEISTITEHRVVDTTQFGWNGAWQATDRLHFNFDAYRSKAERRLRRQGHLGRLRHRGQPRRRVDMNNGRLPDISVTLEDGRDLATALGNDELGDADYGLHYIGLSGTDVKDKVDGLSVDGELSFDAGASRRWSSAPRAPGARKTRDTIENDTNGGSCMYCNLYGVTFESLGAQRRSQPVLAELHA